jgi:hypothetical protein
LADTRTPTRAPEGNDNGERDGFLPGDHSDSDSDSDTGHSVPKVIEGVTVGGNGVMGNLGARTSRIQVGRERNGEDWEDEANWEDVRGEGRRDNGGGLSAKAGIILVGGFSTSFAVP